MKPRLLPALVLALLLLSSARLSAAGLDGVWRLDDPKPWGVKLHTFVSLHTKDGAQTGGVYPNGSGEIPIRSVREEGGETVFTIDWGWTFHVAPAGENLRVRVVYGDGKTSEGLAVPATAAELLPPAPIPLPAERVLPDNGLARTPPMGWNSWNHFAENVDERVVRETADAMVKSGMAAAGYTYINIDDTWEAGRDAKGEIQTNAKFGDMKALADYVHSKGLKLGIYSSPGPLTCGGYTGSFGQEEQDAKAFARWGIDYLKYDWCSAGRVYPNSALRAGYQKMGEALLALGRPIVYSLCEYGMEDVWTWGPLVSGNLWRTTGDISDNWASMDAIGFNQGKIAAFAGPGRWNDPDMLEVGNGGMSATEYRTHFSLWCLLAAPLMAGNDLRTMSDETRDILTNREVIALDQDPLGREATRAFARDGIEVFTKPLVDGSVAVGVFNRNAAEKAAAFPWVDAGITRRATAVRDLWRHQDLPVSESFTGTLPGHGCVILRVRLVGVIR